MTTLFDDLDIGPEPRRISRKRLQLAQPVFEKPVGWAPFASELPELHGETILDLETKDRGLAEGTGSSWHRHDGGAIVGFAVGTADREFYLPIGHSEGNLDADRATRWLKAQAEKPDVSFVYANSPYDMGWLRSIGIVPKGLPYDVQAEAAIIDEHRRNYSLDALGREYLGEGKSDDTLKEACRARGLVDPMSNMDMVPAWLAESYALQDIRLTRGLREQLKVQISKQSLDDIYHLERECLCLAVDMKAQGVRVDLDRVERLLKTFTLKRDEYIRLVYDLTQIRVSPNDSQAITRAIQKEHPKFTGESIAEDVLNALPDSPAITAIKWMRKYEGAMSKTLRGMLRHQYRGRIHADFKPLPMSDETGAGGASSGRWSSSHINMQNIPIRIPEIGVPIRSCFIPEEGCEWAKLDYASQEPRLTIHYAYLMWSIDNRICRGALAMVERFRENPLTDLHLETALLMFGHTKETWAMLDAARRKMLRGRAKIINLAIAYGAGGGNIADQLGLPKERKSFEKDGRTISYWAAGPEAQALLDKHLAGLPWLKELQKIAKARAEMMGYVLTILGRRVRFQQYGNEFARTHKALNSVIQGSAADQLKKAIVMLRRMNIIVPLIVHDEGDLSVLRGSTEFIAKIKQVMEEAVPLSMPVIAELKMGADWGAVSAE